MALTPGVPLSPPAKTSDMQQVIILFSDGLNTENHWHDEQQPIDARQAKTCKNIKDAGITIYTVLVMSGFSQVMKDCASKPEYYYEVTSANQTVAAFNAIGTSLTKLRIAQWHKFARSCHLKARPQGRAYSCAGCGRLGTHSIDRGRPTRWTEMIGFIDPFGSRGCLADRHKGFYGRVVGMKCSGQFPRGC